MKIQFATLAIPPFWNREAQLLIESLRKYGGPLSSAPVTALTLQNRHLPADSEDHLNSLQVDLGEFTMVEGAQQFPLALVPFGAAAAEELAGDADLLVWLLPDTLIVNAPENFELDESKKLAYRPVHHQNVGSTFHQPLDAFWQAVYRHCEVPEECLFPMETCYREMVRPYFNAGILVTRPEEGLFQKWLEVFLRTYRHPDFTSFYVEQKYAVFMHQAILSGVILNQFDPGQLLELPESYNYPLHMHPDYPPEGKAASLQALTTVRYENLKQLPEFLKDIETAHELYGWLSRRFIKT